MSYTVTLLVAEPLDCSPAGLPLLTWLRGAGTLLPLGLRNSKLGSHRPAIDGAEKTDLFTVNVESLSKLVFSRIF